MEKINCATSNCEHNLKGVCLAGVISIGENAKCMSRIKREGGALAQNFADVEAGDDVLKKTLRVSFNVRRAIVRSIATDFVQTLASSERHGVCNEMQNVYEVKINFSIRKAKL